MRDHASRDRKKVAKASAGALQAHVIEQIAAARDAAGLTVYELGDLIGVSGEAISALERGTRKKVNLDQIEALCAALKLSPRALLPEEQGGPTAEPLPMLDGKPLTADEKNVVRRLREGGAAAVLQMMAPRISNPG